MPLQKMKRMYPPRPKELEGLPNLDEIETIPEFIEELKDEVRIVAVVVKEYDKIYNEMEASKTKSAFGKKQEELKFRINALNFLINYGEKKLTGEVSTFPEAEMEADEVRPDLSDEVIEPSASEIVNEETIELIPDSSEQKEAFHFDRDKFINKLSKEIIQFAVAYNDGRPKTQELKQMGQDLELYISKGNMTRDEARQIVNEAVDYATKAKGSAMRGIEEILYKQKLLPRFD